MRVQEIARKARAAGLTSIMILASGQLQAQDEAHVYLFARDGRLETTADLLPDASDVRVSFEFANEGAHLWRHDAFAVTQSQRVIGPSWRYADERVVKGRDGYAPPQPLPPRRLDPAPRPVDPSARLAAAKRQQLMQKLGRLRVRG